jgi:hypothetical protein
MFHRHATTATAEPTRCPPEQYLCGAADPSVPTRACCCPARPMFKILMPPTAARPRPVDLWLCGHHYQASQQSLAAAGARVYRLGTAPDAAAADRMMSTTS